jgi:large subunit ribosomal protein L34e
MPSPRYRSRTYRRVRKPTPSGVSKIYYSRRKPKQSHCAGCGAELKGMPRARPVELKNMAKSKKRPERPFGGELCTKCMRKKMITRARENA